MPEAIPVQPTPTTPPPAAPVREHGLTDDEAAARFAAIIDPKPPAKPDSPPAAEAAEAEAAPDDDRPSGEDAQPEPAQEPPIEAPAFWKKAAKELFATLPRDLQTQLVERERERDTEIRRLQNDAADKRKSSETERNEAEQLKNHYTQQLTAFIPLLQQQLQGKWAGIDMLKLSRENPTEYVALKAEMEQDVSRFQAAQLEQRRIAEQSRHESTKAFETFKHEQEVKLAQAIPEWGADVTKGQKEIEEIHKYLVNDIGIEPERVGRMINAEDFIVARKAMLYDRIMKAKPQDKKVAAPAPKVVRPGAAPDKGQKSEEFAAAQSRLRKSGKLQDAASVFLNLV